MSQNETMNIENQVKLMKQYEEEAKAFAEKAKKIEDSIKTKMTENGLDEIRTPSFVIRFIQVLSSRFDTKRFKEEIGEDVYAYYTKEVSSMRFTISG